MTLSTGLRRHHFKNTQPTDPNILPFGQWTPANRRFHADFCLWLRQGGYSDSAIRTYGVGARLALGLLAKPIQQIDPGKDNQEVREYLETRPLSPSTRAGYTKGLNKLAEYMYQPKPEKMVNWDGYFDGISVVWAEAIRGYIEHRSRNWNDDNRIQLARNLLAQLCGFVRLAQPGYIEAITPKVWFAYTSARAKEKIKPASLNTVLGTLRSFLHHQKEMGHPICERMLAVRPQKKGKTLPKDLSIANVRELLKVTTTDPFDRAWLLTMLHSGLRTAEIRRLEWKDIDLERRTLHIEQGKGSSDRLVPISSQAAAALWAMPKTPGMVFTYHHRPLSGRYCQSRLATLGKACKVKASPHQLRHTAATLLLNAGMSVWSVKEILGHRHVDTTMKYARTYDSTVEREYQMAIAQNLPGVNICRCFKALGV